MLVKIKLSFAFLIFNLNFLAAQFTCQDVEMIIDSVIEYGITEEAFQALDRVKQKVDNSPNLPDSCMFKFYQEYTYHNRAINFAGIEIIDSIISLSALKDYPKMELLMLADKVLIMYSQGILDSINSVLDQTYTLFDKNRDVFTGRVDWLGIVAMGFSDNFRIEESNTIINYVVEHTEPNDTIGLFSAYYRISLNKYNFQDPEGALESALQAKKYLSDEFDKEVRAEFNNVMGIYYNSLEQYSKAKRYLFKVESITSNPVRLMYTYSTLLNIPFEDDTLNMIETRILDLLSKNTSDGPNLAIVNREVYRALAVKYYERGDLEKHTKVTKALTSKIDTSDNFNAYAYYYLLMQNFLLSKNTATEREILDNFLSLKNKMNDETIVESNNKLKIEFDTQLKEEENNRLKAEQLLKEEEIAKQRNYILGGGIGLGLVSLLSFLLFQQSKKRKQLNQTLSNQKDQIGTLNQELNHRVKNNLTFMTSLLEMQGRRTDNIETKAALKESESRLKTLSIVHGNLYENKTNTQINLGHYLKELTNHLSNIFELPQKSLTINTSIDKINIDAEVAIRIGLIINELVTNSAKHAFENIKNPEINITTSSVETGSLMIKYKDNGPGINNLSDSKDSTNLGKKLIHLLAKQINGTLSSKGNEIVISLQEYNASMTTPHEMSSDKNKSRLDSAIEKFKP